MSLRLPEIVCSAPPSDRLVRALAPFGLIARRGENIFSRDVVSRSGANLLRTKGNAYSVGMRWKATPPDLRTRYTLRCMATPSGTCSARKREKTTS